LWPVLSSASNSIAYGYSKVTGVLEVLAHLVAPFLA